MTVASLAQLLLDHVGHRTTIVEPTPGRSLSLKCVDCTRLVDLSGVLGLRPSTAQPLPPPTRPPADIPLPEQCQLHIGEPAHSCGRCRSEALAPDDRPVPEQVRTGSAGWERDDWQAAKAEMAARRRKHHATPVQAPNDPPPNQETP